MDTFNSQIILDDKLILPQSIAENIIYSDTTLKNAFDNYSPITMSNFGKNICKCSSLADVCRLFHINYFFAKDIIDNVVWNITGNPTVDNQKLHSTNGNYIYRPLALGAYDLICEFDLTCSDINKVAFQFLDGFSPSNGNLIIYHYSRSYTYGAWNSDYKYYANAVLGSCSNQNHVKITFDKTNNYWQIYLGGSLRYDYTAGMSSRNWRVCLGTSADCYIDNFSLTYNSNIISELNFD